ncbi:hypothetical protein M9X92_011184 [Pyricularia oryzae]|nr:hypothetical protein M9X92_011184 [Pyricularia oryzae]
MSKSHGVTLPGDPFSPGQLLREPDSWIPPEPVSSDYKTRNALLHSSDDKMCALPKPSSGDGNKGRGVDAGCRLPRHDVGVAVDASCHRCRGAGEQHLLHAAQYIVKNGAHRSGRDALRGSIVAVGLRNRWGGGATCGSSGTGKENLVAQRHEEDAGCSVRNVDPQAGRQEFITNEWYERKKHAFFAPLSRPRAGPTCRMLGVPADGENGGGFAMC